MTITGYIMQDITIYHNPQCGTSRNTLALLEEAGYTPHVIEYLKNPPDRATLVSLIQGAGLPVREMMRQKDALYEEQQLADPKWTDDQLIDLMLAHPILINRPIVVTPLGVRLCRPKETVREILPQN